MLLWYTYPEVENWDIAVSPREDASVKNAVFVESLGDGLGFQVELYYYRCKHPSQRGRGWGAVASGMWNCPSRIRTAMNSGSIGFYWIEQQRRESTKTAFFTDVKSIAQIVICAVVNFLWGDPCQYRQSFLYIKHSCLPSFLLQEISCWRLCDTIVLSAELEFPDATGWPLEYSVTEQSS